MFRCDQNKAGFTIIELAITLAIIVICITLLLPAVQRSRNQARAARCKDNLKQIGLALHNYHDVHRTFPPGWISHSPYAQSKSAYGWQTMILPFIDQAPLYTVFNFDVPVGKDAFGRESRAHRGEKNTGMEKTILTVYRCSEDTTEPLNTMRGGWATSNYSGNFGSKPVPRIAPNDTAQFWPGGLITPLYTNGLFYANSQIEILDIRDGTSNTIMVGERSIKSAAGIWAGVRSNSIESDQVTDSSFGNEINSNLGSFSSLHGKGAHFVFCDGRVKFISEDIQSLPDKAKGEYGDEAGGTFQKLATRAGGEVVREY